jgi:multisubunit Na+/H+ antiporter MnhC subunit
MTFAEKLGLILFIAGLFDLQKINSLNTLNVILSLAVICFGVIAFLFGNKIKE